MIIHSNLVEKNCHLLTLLLIFGLTIANLIISSIGLWGGAKVAAIILGCINLVTIFVYSMFISSSYCNTKDPKEQNPEGSNLHKPFYSLTGFISKGYDSIPPTYNNEPERSN